MQIIGHRGARGLSPENTVKGIKFALTRGVDWVEFDVRTTKDNIAVVVHDRTLLRIARQRRSVQDFTLEQLRLVATRSGEPVPTLTEVLQVVGKKARVIIELKDKRAAKPVVAEINRLIEAGQNYGDFLVGSLHARFLYQTQRLDKKIPLMLIQSIWPFWFLTLPGLKLSAVGFWRFLAPRLAINLAKNRALFTAAYTVNNKLDAERFKKRGIDALITDVPQEFKPLWPLLLRWSVLAIILAAIAILLVLN